jgi:hypothetical protein
MSLEESKTFKERVEEFWEWYQQVAERFFQTIENNQCADLVDEVSEKMGLLLYDMAWVFGPGENGGHSLTVSGEGLVVKQMLAKYWAECAPPIPGWTFYGSRQPSLSNLLGEMQISVSEEESVDAKNFNIRIRPNKDEQLFDIIAWHENLRIVPEEHHHQILFLLLDEALGEFGTSMWIGEIKIKPIPEEKVALTLDRLAEYISKQIAKRGWEKLPPLEEYAVYRMPSQSDFPRGDTVVGMSCMPQVVWRYFGRRLAGGHWCGTSLCSNRWRSF